jgi:hypothetical protein
MHPSKFTPIIISTVIITTISIFPFLNFINLICCAGVIIGVIAGAGYYNNQLKKNGEVIQFKDGAAIGILSGVLSALLVVIITTLISLVLRQNPIPTLYNIIDKQGVTLPPDVEVLLQKISDEYSRNGFSITLTVANFILYILIYPLFGLLGGILGVSIFSRRKNVQ